MCPGDGCAKKVIEINDAQYRCIKCDKIHDRFEWGYMAKVKSHPNFSMNTNR